jgi:GNAT superfamily N-acetyltransferase
MKDNIERGEVYLAKDLDGIVGTITLQWTDLKYWGDLPPDSGYVHKFAVKRSHSGKGLGVRMLQWAEQKTKREGKKYLRLDCLATNKIIRAYYEKAGFVYIRDTTAPGWKASLYEKRL